MALVIKGRVVTLADHSDPNKAASGKVWIDDDGLIASVTAEGDREPSGFASAKEVDVGHAWVMPGLIDLHSHVAYNSLPCGLTLLRQLPLPITTAGTTVTAISRRSRGPRGCWSMRNRKRSSPTRKSGRWPADDLDPGMAAGQSRALQLVRKIDTERGSMDRKVMEQSVATLTPAQLMDRASDERDDHMGFIYHCAEGQPQPQSPVVREFTNVVDAGCLLKTFIGIHCTALAASDWTHWPAKTGAVVWSPFSNLWLYGRYRCRRGEAARRSGVLGQWTGAPRAQRTCWEN
jgi:hypothetical protein